MIDNSLFLSFNMFIGDPGKFCEKTLNLLIIFFIISKFLILLSLLSFETLIMLLSIRFVSPFGFKSKYLITSSNCVDVILNNVSLMLISLSATNAILLNRFLNS